jgi:hypothetical protein
VASTIPIRRKINNAYPSNDKITQGQANSRNEKPQKANPKKKKFDVFSDSDNVPLPQEKSFILGLFNDQLKTIAKILTGSLFTDVLKGMLRDKSQTWQSILYRNIIDSLPARLLTDFGGTLAVRLFSGNYKFLGMPLYLPPEISSQLITVPINLITRAATSGQGVNKKSAENNQSSQEKEIKKAMDEHPSWFLDLCDWVQVKFESGVMPVADKVLQKVLGIYNKQALTDKEGNLIFETDDKGQVLMEKYYDKDSDTEKEKPKVLYSNRKVDLSRLLMVTGGTFIGSFFLPRATASFGFEKARTFTRGAIATAFTTLCRQNTSLLHNAAGMLRHTGKNFDACFRTAVVEKTIVPIVQYCCDWAGATLAKTVPINGAAIANVLRIVAEIPATFLSSGLINIAKGDRMDDEWKYISNKLARPLMDVYDKATRPVFKFLAQNLYGPILGLFDAKIPNMYDVDIRNPETAAKDKLDPALEAKYGSHGIASALGLFVKKLAMMPIDIVNLIKRCDQDAKDFEASVAKKVEARNALVDLKNQALKIINELGLENGLIKPSAENQELNRQIIDLYKSKQIDQIKQLVSGVELVKITDNKADTRSSQASLAQAA